jgi:hypothetical protein
METALNTHMSKPEKFGKRPLLTNIHHSKEDSKFNMFLNPAVESFLSFSLENNQTGLQTNVNVTMLNQTSALPQGGNLFDNTMFTHDDRENYFNPDQTFAGADASGYPDLQLQSHIASATPSKLKNPFMPTAESIFQRRSHALQEKLVHSH